MFKFVIQNGWREYEMTWSLHNFTWIMLSIQFLWSLSKPTVLSQEDRVGRKHGRQSTQIPIYVEMCLIIVCSFIFFWMVWLDEFCLHKLKSTSFIIPQLKWPLQSTMSFQWCWVGFKRQTWTHTRGPLEEHSWVIGL